jgi:hypothetical protein
MCNITNINPSTQRADAAGGRLRVLLHISEVACRLGYIVSHLSERYEDWPPSGDAGIPTAAQLLLFPDKNYHKPHSCPRLMAKSDSFFIRATVTTSSTSFNQSEIDLGSFVNLGVTKSTLLRIHNIQPDYKDASDPGAYIYYDGGIPGAQVLWQLTTQSQSDMVYAEDKSYVSGGAMKQASTTGVLVQNTDETVNTNPQEWRNGYLIGVDSLYIGCQSSGTWDTGEVRVDLVLECTLETATQASATALALSQQ